VLRAVVVVIGVDVVHGKEERGKREGKQKKGRKAALGGLVLMFARTAACISGMAACICPEGWLCLQG
jgi:hypothetical protein